VSRIGKNPIAMPAGIELKVEKTSITVKGPKGSLRQEIHPEMKVEAKDGHIHIARPNDSKYYRALHGLYRSLINNMVTGVSAGFERKLEIVGVGYKAELINKRLSLQLGYSHPIVFVPPDEIEIRVDSPNSIAIRGTDKELVGQVASKIRSFRPPEPYKGKGVKYADELIRRKAGKTAA
jgi:large subunit ribosomal protein L6